MQRPTNTSLDSSCLFEDASSVSWSLVNDVYQLIFYVNEESLSERNHLLLTGSCASLALIHIVENYFVEKRGREEY